MLESIEKLLKPEYFLQPRQFVRRLLGRTTSPGPDGGYVLPLPWDVALEVHYRDDLARAIDTLGVYDLVVTEAIWRLVRPGDTVLDVGANVGYMSLVAAARMGLGGRVFAFEPHPQLFDELSRNASRVRTRFPGVAVTPRREALSDSAGTAWLHVPKEFAQKRGLSSISATREGIEIVTKRLDDCASEFGNDIALMKIDVEGHEPAVFRGARSLLESGAVRHIILEEHGRYPTEAVTFLEGMGYVVFGLERSLFQARLVHPSLQRRSTWEPPNLVATRRIGEVEDAFRSSGWQCLTSRAHSR